MERSRTMRLVCFQFKKTTCQTCCSCRTPKHCSWEPLTRDQIIACTYWLSSVLEQISAPLINSCPCAPTHARKHTHLPLTLSNACKCPDLIGRCTWGDHWYAIGCCGSIKWSGGGYLARWAVMLTFVTEAKCDFSFCLPLPCSLLFSPWPLELSHKRWVVKNLALRNGTPL